MAEPFACGHIFVSTVFDSLTTVAFHSPGTIDLLENLLGIGSHGDNGNSIIQIPVTSSELSHFIGGCYKRIYDHFCLRNILCIALYRQIRSHSKYRYVITAPSKELLIEDRDLIFAIKLSLN